MARPQDNPLGNIALGDPASIVVIGGGPAGCFFAIEALSGARRLGRRLQVTIIEQKIGSPSPDACCSPACREGCNYCAGGISPRLVDVLDEAGITLPSHIIQSEVESVTIQGSWKHIELRVPAGRKMLAVYRGTRPHSRSQRNDNFDSYLLECAMAAGAQVVTGRAVGVEYSADGKPVVRCLMSALRRTADIEGTADIGVTADIAGEEQLLKADFLVVAGGVNQAAGMSLEQSELVKSLRVLIPRFVPPRVRKALIGELKAEGAAERSQTGDVYFIEYGSRELKVEMSSLLPKKEGFITLVVLGKSVDEAGETDRMGIIRRFLALPHLKRLLPPRLGLKVMCACLPNMTIGAARNGFGQRVAMIGDLVVARLYKDGILSAHQTATALAHCVLERGVDVQSLKEGFWPVVESLRRDNRFGRVVFFLNRVAFSNPVLSRVLYQAVLTERRSRRDGHRHLETLLWKIASGDDTYASILRSMVTGRALKDIFVGGLLVTIRNYFTELLFGLSWRDIGRHPTGAYWEATEGKRKEYSDRVAMPGNGRDFDCERIYSIKIRAGREVILEQLGHFGETNMGYFKPRIVKIRKISGSGNEAGKVIRYDTPLRVLNISIALESVLEDRYIVYRVCSGFAEGGVLVFDVEETGPDLYVLSIYVAFNFPRGRSLFERAYWRTFKALFPQFVHDVLWNNALCLLKDIAES